MYANINFYLIFKCMHILFFSQILEAFTCVNKHTYGNNVQKFISTNAALHTVLNSRNSVLLGSEGHAELTSQSAAQYNTHYPYFTLFRRTRLTKYSTVQHTLCGAFLYFSTESKQMVHEESKEKLLNKCQFLSNRYCVPWGIKDIILSKHTASCTKICAIIC